MLDEPTPDTTEDEVKAQDNTVTVATDFGYAFQASNPDIPLVTAAGVQLTREQADEVLAESAQYSPNHVSEVTDTDENA